LEVDEELPGARQKPVLVQAAQLLSNVDAVPPADHVPTGQGTAAAEPVGQ